MKAALLALLLVMAAGAVAAFYVALGTNRSAETPSSECRGSARCFRGSVTQVVDGDTLDVGTSRIRLALLNTPEVGEPGYQEAKDFAASLCPVGSEALVDEDDGQTEGSYGRILAQVTCGGKNLNAQLLQAGHAELLVQFCDVSEFASETWAAGCP